MLSGSLEERPLGERKMESKWIEIRDIAQNDIRSLIESEKSYGDSWKRRGGTGAFMMLARKFDRIEQQSEKCNYDVFTAGSTFTGEEGLLDDIGDLRRYLLLVEHHIRYAQIIPTREEIVHALQSIEDQEEMTGDGPTDPLDTARG